MDTFDQEHYFQHCAVSAHKAHKDGVTRMSDQGHKIDRSDGIVQLLNSFVLCWVTYVTEDAPKCDRLLGIFLHVNNVNLKKFETTINDQLTFMVAG